MKPEIATLASPTLASPTLASPTRFWLAVCVVMLALIGLVMITVGVVAGQPGLVLVATMSTIAGGASVASAYAVHRKAIQ